VIATQKVMIRILQPIPTSAQIGVKWKNSSSK